MAHEGECDVDLSGEGDHFCSDGARKEECREFSQQDWLSALGNAMGLKSSLAGMLFGCQAMT